MRRGRVEWIWTGTWLWHQSATLTIDAGAEIRFARGDAQGTGFDPDRSELIVYGDLKIGEGASFASGAPRTGPLDWSGIYLLDGQAIDPAAIAH